MLQQPFVHISLTWFGKNQIRGPRQRDSAEVFHYLRLHANQSSHQVKGLFGIFKQHDQHIA